jgi:hypothetical protein
MSEAPPPIIDEDEAALAEIARMDLSLARHIHAQALATTDPDALNGLGRSYQRLARSLRQTLMAKAKLARERVAAAEAVRKPPTVYPPTARERLTDARIEDLQDAVARVAAAAHPDAPKRQREALDRLDLELEDWIDDDDFLLERLDTLVVEACSRADLPLDLARAWEDLPPPRQRFDPAATPAAAADPPSTASPPVPKADTG